MPRPRTGALVGAVLAVAALLVGLVGQSAARAAAEPSWELVALSGPVRRLHAPASGAFFAMTQVGLYRSDNGGSTWEPVALPPETSEAVPDPTDHTRLYAAAAGGLFKSTDDATTWATILPTDETVRAVAVSPANGDLVYVALAGRSAPSGDFRFLRSRDGGATWEQLEEHHLSLCGWGVPLLAPHPTDESRVFRTAGCYAGRNIGDDLEESSDAGTTWVSRFRPDSAFANRLVGGRGGAPDRLYLGANRDPRGGGSLVYRSSDGGSTWTEVLAFRGGGSIEEPTQPNVTLVGLAYDPARPDRVYVGLNVRPAGGGPAGEVRTSADGGTTWSDLGRPDPGPINDVVLGVDGLNLYVATGRGLWRLPLAPAAGASALNAEWCPPPN